MPDYSLACNPCNPQSSQYYQCVEDHCETLELVYDEDFAKQYWFFLAYVRQVIYRYLDCGILLNGPARVKCAECGHLLAFSCKRRHFLPSMPSETAGGGLCVACRQGLFCLGKV